MSWSSAKICSMSGKSSSVSAMLLESSKSAKSSLVRSATRASRRASLSRKARLTSKSSWVRSAKLVDMVLNELASTPSSLCEVTGKVTPRLPAATSCVALTSEVMGSVTRLRLNTVAPTSVSKNTAMRLTTVLRTMSLRSAVGATLYCLSCSTVFTLMRLKPRLSKIKVAPASTITMTRISRPKRVLRRLKNGVSTRLSPPKYLPLPF